MRIKSLLNRTLNGQAAPALTTAPFAKEVLVSLAEQFRTPLLSMFHVRSMAGSDGLQHPIDTQTLISPSQGMWFYDQCCSEKPLATLEIGFVYGFGTIFFLIAIARNTVGQHKTIDPFQRTNLHGIVLVNVRAVDAESSFELIEGRSDREATDLARQNFGFDVIFIESNHCFDDAQIDFYLYVPLCKRQGLITVDDKWMKSVQTVASFVHSNRPDSVEVSTALPRICVFQRIGEDLRQCDHFQLFAVAGNGQVGQ